MGKRGLHFEKHKKKKATRSSINEDGDFFAPGMQRDEPQPEQLAEDRLDPSRRSQKDLHRGQVHTERLQQHAWSPGHLQGNTDTETGPVGTKREGDNKGIKCAGAGGEAAPKRVGSENGNVEVDNKRKKADLTCTDHIS